MVAEATGGRMLAIRIEDDPLIEGVIAVLLIGAVICAAIAAGIEAAALAALLCVRERRYRAQRRRFTELRCQEGAWRIVRADGSVARIESPAVRLRHRALIVLRIVDAGRRADLVFSSTSSPDDDLRKLRVLLRTGARSSVSSS
ncbi:MAG: hypothetical protein ISN28_10060 [Ectothiorhodospiraceae bacterium AqS1]|nr:hypothetical protein [Ectothiorhodospiraceae bacterium AqS1]